MPKNSYDAWDSDPDQNTDVGGVNLAEGQMVVSAVNNALRTIMAQLKAAALISLSTAATFLTNLFTLADNSDATKKLTFNLSGITTATTRTWTAPDANITIAATNLEAQTLTGGANVTVKDLGVLSVAGSNTITPNPGSRPHQKLTNDHAGSVLPGSNAGSYILDILNATGAGALTTTGWTVKGDSFDTTTTSKFRCYCSVTSDAKTMTVLKVA
jgi:hypothetical protein